MSVIAKKVKTTSESTLKLLIKYDFGRMAVYFLIGAGAARANLFGVCLSVLALALAGGEKDTMSKQMILLGGGLCSGLSSLANPSYIPCFVSLRVYAACSAAVKKDEYCMYAAALFYSLGRRFISYRGFPKVYIIYALLEGGAAIALSQRLKEGPGLKGAGLTVKNFGDGFGFFVSILVTGLAFTGFDSRMIYFGCAMALAMSWHYCAAGAGVYSLLGFICSLLLCADRAGFARIFLVISGVWAVGEYFSERFSYLIYPVVIIFAAAANVALIGSINSFAPLSASVMALIIYALMPRFMQTVCRDSDITSTYGKDWRQLMSGLAKLEGSLNFLAGCAVDISNLNERHLRTQSLEDMVAESVCRKCEHNTYCWQERYSATVDRLSMYAKGMPQEASFPSYFYSQCKKTDRLAASFRDNFRLSLSKKYIRYSQKNNQKLLQDAFMAVSRAVGDIIRQSRTTSLVNSTGTMLLDKFLNDIGVAHTYCLCSQKPGKADFACLEPVSSRDLYRIKARIENIYGEKFADATTLWQAGEIIYTFMATPRYEYQVVVKDKPLRGVNGDSVDSFCSGGNLYVILSDGMGTGRAAAAESRTAVAMAKSLLQAGVSMHNTVNIVNLAMNLKGSGENTGTLDILRVNLFTGQAEIVKAGAWVSMAVNKDRVERFYGDSLPLGTVKDVKSYSVSFALTARDTFLLMSDGVGRPGESVSRIKDMSAEEAAEFVLKAENTIDDKTVAVVRLIA